MVFAIQQCLAAKLNNIMKTKILTLSALAASVALTSISSALTLKDATFRDVDLINQVLDSSNTSVSSSFDITQGEDGWRDISVPLSQLGSYDILDAIIGFVFLETDGNSQTVVHSAEFRIGNYFSIFGVASDTVLPGDLDDELSEVPYPSAYFQVDFDPSLYPSLGSLVLDVSEDGVVDWKVSLSSQDAQNSNTSVTLFSGYLAVEAQRVPDSGSTASILGLALLGLVFVRKRS